jgi:hypothetical protein
MVQKVVGFYTENSKSRPVTPRQTKRGYRAASKQTFKHQSKYIQQIEDYAEEPETKDIAAHTDGFFDNKNVKPIIIEEKKQSRGYTTSGIRNRKRVTAPTLHKAKVEQRRKVVERMPRGAVLELYAGKGYLTKEVYSKKATRVILVDSNKNSLNSANRRLKGTVKRELIAENNKKWIENEMDPAELRDLTLVDFDAFGSPTETMSTFFDHYPIKRPLYITATDGAAQYYQQNPNARGKESARRLYHNVPRNYGTVRGQVEMLDTFLDKEGRIHHFRAEPVSLAKGNASTIYAGYKLVPN